MTDTSACAYINNSVSYKEDGGCIRIEDEYDQPEREKKESMQPPQSFSWGSKKSERGQSIHCTNNTAFSALLSPSNDSYRTA
ncbi:hypothetical protein QE152_g29734 [Popillia japonica]|uniref:Uncharacterized protein n=1 Tax=Popillia japonica TaxID=7064 RepID=A0AAW1JG20_POPJA